VETMLAERAAASSAILCHCDTLVLIIRFSLFVACSAATFGRRIPSYRFGLLHLGGSSGELKSIHPVMREIVEGFSRNPQHIFRIMRLASCSAAKRRHFLERERDSEKRSGRNIALAAWGWATGSS
jgi:hypothetical protein